LRGRLASLAALFEGLDDPLHALRGRLVFLDDPGEMFSDLFDLPFGEFSILSPGGLPC
jgi:hypothetical protein